MLKRINIDSGVVKDLSELDARPRWVDSQLIRFVQRVPQKVGGWTKTTSLLLEGVCRGLLSWQDANSLNRLACGTHKKLQILESTSLLNITPIRSSGTLGTNPFQTTAGSQTVTVTHAAHGTTIGDTVIYSGATSVGGLTIDGEYTVQSVIDAGSYTIQAASSATSTATGGGSSVTYQYEINIMRVDESLGSGYGTGGYGSGTYGTASDSSIVFPAGAWTLDQWGQFLVACPRGGNIYEWQNNSGSRALLLANAPINNTGILVTEEQILVAIGAGGQKMRVEWSDQSDNTVWAPSDQNTAGGRTLVGGSELLFGVRSRGTNLLFSDASAWTMTFIGGLDVFGFEQVAGGASGIISPRAACDVDGIVYWMGKNDFYMFDGVVRRIPGSKTIRRFVFDNMPELNRSKIFAYCNTLFSEIWWFYVGAGQTEISDYIKYNYDERAWDHGTLTRTAGIDRGVFDRPIMSDELGQLYDHESGVDADGAAMTSYIESSPFDISDGDRIAHVTSYIPDFATLIGSVDISVMTRYYPNSEKIETDIGSVDPTTTQLDLRASGRQVAVKIKSENLGADWRLGVVRFTIEPGGRR